jgi:hypothetical protein
MKSRLNVVTPSLLVAAAFPFFFLAAPDGIPFVYAGCTDNPVPVGVTNLAVNYCVGCSANTGSNDSISLSSCSLTSSSTKCDMYAHVTISITTSDACDAEWVTYCGTAVGQGFCKQVKFATGPVTNQSSSYAQACTVNGDVITIRVHKMGNCNCATGNAGGFVFEGVGTCVIG